ncbi:hypothetical protein DAMA08_051200 [Martiniozyma asiatica (nom. inval.)]|nr:hypothetical protein DAMA08_051200 [Martiniozyma asiatica]
MPPTLAERIKPRYLNLLLSTKSKKNRVVRARAKVAPPESPRPQQPEEAISQAHLLALLTPLFKGEQLSVTIEELSAAFSRCSEKIDLVALLKYGMMIMVGQLYHDPSTNTISFIYGASPLLSRRKSFISADASVALNSTEHESTSSLLGMLPIGTFERCTCVLWNFFQSNVFYELTAILLPLEIESALGHSNSAKAWRVAHGGTAQQVYSGTMLYSEQSNTIETTEENYRLVGTLGEWTELNIREQILVSFRDNVVIPLYELNREYEENDSVPPTKSSSKVEEYNDIFNLVQCLKELVSVLTQDTNQRLVENLMAQMVDRLSQI